MQSSMVIKNAHRMLTAVLLLLVAGYTVYQFYFNSAPDDVLYSQQKITDDTYLYVTKYKDGGATVSDVYRYYLDGKLRGDPLASLKKRAPFMVADVGNAKVTGYGNHIYVNMTGRVYSFTNCLRLVAFNLT